MNTEEGDFLKRDRAGAPLVGPGRQPAELSAHAAWRGPPAVSLNSALGASALTLNGGVGRRVVESKQPAPSILG